ncbi:MAG TPA: hypoxanthine phosphoribosyltransferase [Tepidisphaeraceae bacterium]|jgi:hypoxanthine phosphoribosyltransferase|nr:hypoxanthine phosphoribosyltransferase [Tepidisphaeraceae bacterium]
MQADIERILISRQQIEHRIKEMARQIVADHSNGGEVTLVPILTGAMIFCADLMRQMPIELQIGMMTVSSYPGAATATQGSQLVGQQVKNVTGRHILLLDDILDSGGTLKLVIPLLERLKPASVKVCVLLRKDRPSAREVQADYVGFDIPDEFVVGYGLDYDDYYRNLPDIVTLKREAIEKRK